MDDLVDAAVDRSIRLSDGEMNEDVCIVVERLRKHWPHMSQRNVDDLIFACLSRLLSPLRRVGVRSSDDHWTTLQSAFAG